LWITASALVAAAALACAPPAAAQYPGQITGADKNTPQLRAVGVLEWTGDLDHPKASRLVPICIYDGQDLEDAGVYMAQPAPLALESQVEYQLLQDGKPVGLFDIDRAGRQLDSWFGFGKWKPLPAPKPAPAQVAKIDEEDAQSDVPILHRKHPSGDQGGSNSGSASGADSNSPPPDPDRPTLHKGGDASTSSSASDSSPGSDSNAPAPDSDRPTLHPATNSSSAGAPSGSDHPKPNKKNEEDESYVDSVTTLTDPGRPHLFRGKSAGVDAPVLPSLIGLPPDMHQEVAVSDAKTRPVHVWDYVWANPDDEAKMKAAMEDLARTALGLNPPAPPAKPQHASKTASAHKTAKPAPPPAPLLDEQFRVFELAYGSGATMVLSAHTAGSGAEQKFVTLVAQPDLYGGVAVLVRNVADAAHLDDTPRMKLIDAVDARADNRGELLFELRGAAQRQFALYRVLRGEATRIFLSGAEAIGVASQ
jgi:hypothetical protein